MKLKILGVVETFALDELIADPLDHAFRVVRRLHITKYTPCVVFLTVTPNRDTHTQRRGRGSRVQRLECIHAADVVAVSLGVAEKTLHVTRKRSQLHRKQWYSLFQRDPAPYLQIWLQGPKAPDAHLSSWSLETKRTNKRLSARFPFPVPLQQQSPFGFSSVKHSVYCCLLNA